MLKKFPISLQKILPAAALCDVAAVVFTGCQSTTSVEASTTRDPVVAPAGTVLRVRLDHALNSERSRPGDRFDGILDSAVVAGATEVLPKGSKVEGHVTATHELGYPVLAVTLDSVDLDGQQFSLSTTIVTRTGTPVPGPESVMLQELTGKSAEPGLNTGSREGRATAGRVLLPAESIVGFTLQRMFALRG